jgi:SAM-dependent methyltransferase
VKTISRYKGNILDIGFGYGDIEKKLKYSKYRSLYGVDISTVAVENLRKIVSGNFRKGNIFNLPYKNCFFDIVLALDVLEHLPPKMIFKAYKEIGRVLKNGGMVIISVPLNENLEEMLKRGQNPNSHLRAYTPNIIKLELEISKFMVIKELYFFAFSKFYFLKSILVRLIPYKIRKPNLIVLEAIKR